MKIPSLCATALMLSLAALNASYADPAPKSRTVQFADLDLSKTAGAATLFSRIKGAAQEVCGDQRGGMTLRDHERHAACMKLAVSDAVASVDEPMLTQYVASRSDLRRQLDSRIASSR